MAEENNLENVENESQTIDAILPRPVETEITQSYIDYAMSVIVSRALPDVRDGLKPVLRRILFTMYEMRLVSWGKHKKSMWVVGQTLRDYHPHGDTSVYDAMVRLAQPFAMRYPMVNGQGNFGSIDGDGAAAARYTEAKLTKIAEEMLEDINLDTVDWRPNYDQSRNEPITLPTKFPYVLCNGTMGIAVGMATNMPPHNLSEVIDACLLLIDNGDAEIEEIMQHIKGPDFPTGGMIFDEHNIKDVYSRGKGGIVMRGKVEFEETEKGADVIVIKELPYQVNKANLVAKIGELVQTKKLEWITDITDESNRDAMRVTIVLKKGITKEEMLIRLYKYTDLQTNFNVNNVALIERGKQPRHLNVKEILMQFVDYRREVVLRRSEFQLKKATDRLHILEGLQRAIDILDDVIETIKKSNTREEAKQNLMDKYTFSDPQAEYILMLRLQTLVGLEIQKILNEIGEKAELIAYLEGIINDPAKRDALVADELIYMKDTYGDERRTELSNDTSVYELNKNIKALKKLDELIKEPVIAWIGNDSRVKVLYQTRILNIPEDTFILAKTHNQDKMIALSDTGELVVQRLKDLGKFTTKSDPLDVVKEYGIKGNLIFSITLAYDFDYLVFVTDKNNIKKIKKDLILKFRKFPTVVMGLDPKEKIINVIAIKDEDKIGLVSQQGKILIFREKFVRPMGKTAWGVKGIDLADGDTIADMFLYKEEPFVFIHDGQNGKLVSVEDLLEQKARGEMKRGQSWVICAETKKWQKLQWAIAITEGAVMLELANGRIDKLDSEKMDLGLPEDDLSKITNSTITKMYRPWSEKEDGRTSDEEETK